MKSRSPRRIVRAASGFCSCCTLDALGPPGLAARMQPRQILSGGFACDSFSVGLSNSVETGNGYGHRFQEKAEQ
jgi:hypothetical protein